MYEVGKVHVWVKCIAYPHIVGQETTVIGEPEEFYDAVRNMMLMGQKTDTVIDGINGFALQGHLRPKNPPSGEKSIMDQFSRPINTKTPEMA